MRLYALTDDRLAVLTDDDEWAVASTASPGTTRHECVAVSGSHVLVGTVDEGLWRSVDGGATFERVAGLDAAAVTSVAVGGGGGTGREWWVGTEPSAVYRSVDGGETFTEREGLTALESASTWSFPPRPDTHHVRWLEVDPHDPAHLYVAVEAGALVQTHDAGETWEDRVPGSRRDTHTMATHPDAPGRAYGAAGDGYAETLDGGETWHHPQAGLEHRYCWSVAVDAADPDVRLLSAARGAMTAHRASSADSYLYRKRGDDDWERLDGLPTGEGVTRYVLESGAAGEFFALSNRGLFRTGDAGESWRRLPLDVTASTSRGLVAVPS